MVLLGLFIELNLVKKKQNKANKITSTEPAKVAMGPRLELTLLVYKTIHYLQFLTMHYLKFNNVIRQICT